MNQSLNDKSGQELWLKSRKHINNTKDKEIFSPKKGLRFWNNPNNRFSVLEVHYSADPKKDPDTPEGKKWIKHAKEGLSKAQWAQEYEIDDQALAVSSIYPQWNFDTHVLSGISIEDIPSNWTCYFALDIGIEAPTAALWIAVSPDNFAFVYDEYYERNKTIGQNAELILEKEKNHPMKPWLRLIDPAAFGRELTGITPAIEYQKHGLACVPAVNDLIPGIKAVRSWLAGDKVNDKDRYPKIVFLPHLTNTFYEFKNYKINTRTDKPARGNDHLMDCLRYIIMASPHFVPKDEDNSGWETVIDPYTGYVRHFEKEVI